MPQAAFRIVTQDTKRTSLYTNVQLDTTRLTAILIRQSKRGSDAEHYEGRLLQESLLPFVIVARGDEDDRNIHVFDEGAGVSGTKGIDKRGKVKRLFEEINDNLIGDLVLARPDRLFRDKHFSNVSTFTELAEKRRLKVIVPQAQGAIVYDFTREKDLQAFQEAMIQAYAYLVNQIGYMQRARDNKMSRGLYGGGCVPLPYVLVRGMAKEMQVQVVYEPWVEIALDLFKKFIEFNFETGRIARFVEDKPYLFPFMCQEHLQEYQPITNMHRTAKGYTFTQLKTIKYYLSNLVLGGYAHGGRDASGQRLLIEGAFDAVIPLDLLEPCFAAIKGHYLDGTPFVKPQSWRQYQRRDIETDAVAHGLMTSDDGAISLFAQLEDDEPGYVCLKGGYFGQKYRCGLDKVLRAWSLNVRPFDTMFIDRLIALAEFDHSLVDRVREYFSKPQPEGKSSLEVLDTAIHNTQKAIKRVSRSIVLSTEGNLDDEGEEIELAADDPLIIEKRGLQVQLRRLQKQREDAAKTANEDPGLSISNFYHVLSHMRAEFNKQDPQTKKDIIRRLTDEIKVNCISPHLYTLHVRWIEPLATGRDDVALLWRALRVKDESWNTWTEEEEEALRLFYPQAVQLDLLKAIPNKTAWQIKKRAWQLGVKRDYRHIDQTGRFHGNVCYNDLQAVAQFAGDEEEKLWLWGEVNRMSEETRQGALAAIWFLPIDALSFSQSLCVTGATEGGQSRISV
jgi:hypothetical protein